MEILKVSAKSSPNSVAGALAGVLRERGGAEIQAIGAGALNQAVKAVAIARGFVAPSGMDLICVPAFTDILIDAHILQYAWLPKLFPLIPPAGCLCPAQKRCPSQQADSGPAVHPGF
jgi:stage V sporulation protein S